MVAVALAAWGAVSPETLADELTAVSATAPNAPVEAEAGANGVPAPEDEAMVQFQEGKEFYNQGQFVAPS